MPLISAPPAVNLIFGATGLPLNAPTPWNACPARVLRRHVAVGRYQSQTPLDNGIAAVVELRLWSRKRNSSC
jgi:hypothetical protein